MPAARQDRRDIWDYIAADSPAAASAMDARFSDAVRKLTTYPHLGKVGEIEGTRELFPHKSYRLVYEVHEDAISILALVHTSRRWPPGASDDF